MIKKIIQYSLFIIAGMLLIVGAIIYWGFQPFDLTHILLLCAALVLLLTFVLNNNISKRYRKYKDKK